MTKEFKGQCAGVRLKPRNDCQRGESDPHIIFEILVEDDESWNPTRASFSSAWIDDLINVLQEAKQWMRSSALEDRYDVSVSPPKPTDDVSGRMYGYKFKNSPNRS